MPAGEKQKMLAGEPYRASDPELWAERRRCQAMLRRCNDELEDDVRMTLFREVLGSVGEETLILPTFVCDYGYNVSIGARSFINYGAMVLDVTPVSIGDDVQIATAVQILTADHPLDPEARRSGVESGSSIAIEDGAWIGGGAILCPGVTVGSGSVIGAGSVVTRDIPPRVVAVGSPCRVIRRV